MKTNEFLQKYRKVMSGGYNYTRPRIKCADGFTISVQAGKGIYSDPRCDADEYKLVELGFPSEIEESLTSYMEDYRADPRKTVYPYVPVDVVDEVLEKHGGIAGADFSNGRRGVWQESK